MVLAATFIETLALAIGVWAATCAVQGAVAGFIALICGCPFERVEREFIYGSIAGAFPGFLLFIATVILASD
jgi:hypothetical protein